MKYCPKCSHSNLNTRESCENCGCSLKDISTGLRVRQSGNDLHTSNARKNELINRIVNEVTNEGLRNELLKQVLADNHDEPRETSDSRYMNHSRSLVMNELMHLGVNPRHARDYMRFQLKAGVTIGYVVSVIFILIGLVGIVMLLMGEEMGLFFLFFGCFGVYGFVSTSKLDDSIN